MTRAARPQTKQAFKLLPHVRWLIRRDLPETLAIEAASFTPETERWGEADYLKALRRQNCIGMVAEVGERIVGSMVYELHKSHLTLLKLSVHLEFRRAGVGSAMIGKLVGKLSSHRRIKILLVCPETMLDAQLFFRAQGFMARNVIRDAFGGSLGGPDCDVWQDGYRFVYEFDSECDGDGDPGNMKAGW